jgi:hypothetical protein
MDDRQGHSLSVNELDSGLGSAYLPSLVTDNFRYFLALQVRGASAFQFSTFSQCSTPIVPRSRLGM